MPAISRLLQYNTPGVYVNEDTFGSIPTPIATHDTVYVLGTCTNASFPFDKPVYISNHADFLNQCGTSPSSAAIKLFFDQKSGQGLYFIQVTRKVQRDITVVSVSTSSVYTVNINSTAFSYTATASDTTTTVATKLLDILETNLAGVVNGSNVGAIITLRSKPTDVITITGTTLTLGTTTTLGLYPVASDVIDTAYNAFTPEDSQGFLCCPEFYQQFTTLAARTILQTQLDAFCSQPDYYWVHVADCGNDTATSTVGNGSISLVVAEDSTFVSPRGSSFYYFPYLVNLAGTNVPASLGAVGAGLRRARAEGIYQPFAGVKTNIYGVTGTSFNVSASQQSILNPKGINCIRVLPGRGVVVYGARTLSNNSFYRFSATRIILNILAGTLRKSFDEQLFSLVDGQGALFARIEGTADTICESLRNAGALYGATPDEAYLNICDTTNNTPVSLETGTVYLDCIVKPSPTMEVLAITVSRSSLGQVLASIKASGDPVAVQTKP
jgi:phage tail sheath protein FI